MTLDEICLGHYVRYRAAAKFFKAPRENGYFDVKYSLGFLSFYEDCNNLYANMCKRPTLHNKQLYANECMRIARRAFSKITKVDKIALSNVIDHMRRTNQFANRKVSVQDK